VKSTVHLSPGTDQGAHHLQPRPAVKVVTNIRRADINGDKGWVVLELEGKGEDIERGIVWVTGKGVRVDPVIGDIVEG